MDFDLFPDGSYFDDPTSHSQPQEEADDQRGPAEPVKDAPPSPPKSSRKNPKQGSEPRQRGRPRLHTRDETATQRRRTQIRLAQRAYRQRKETTITALKKRVTTLETVIQGMNQAFLDYQNLALASNIHHWSPELASRLQSTAEKFEELAKEGTHQSELEFEENEPLESPDPVPGQRDVRPDAGMQMWGYETTFDPSSWNPQMDQPYPFQQPQQAQPQQPPPPPQPEQPQRSPFNPEEFPRMFHCQFPQPTIPADVIKLPYPAYNLVPPTTHAYTETSFTRRLMRMAIERAIRILSDPTATPDLVADHFRLTFTWGNKAAAKECLLQLAFEDTSNGLEVSVAPRYHLGRAGLHYPRHGIDASSPTPEWVGMDGAARPFLDFGRPDNCKYANWAFDDMIRDLGMEGEWFDANDVEEYLRTKGMNFDAISSVVEGPDSADRSQSTGNGAQHRPASNVARLHAALMDVSGQSFQTWTGHNDHVRVGEQIERISRHHLVYADGPLSTTTPPMSNHTLPPFDHNCAFPMPMYSPKKFMQVDKFLEDILSRSRCLGRTTGFRRVEVEEALQRATVWETELGDELAA